MGDMPNFDTKTLDMTGWTLDFQDAKFEPDGALKSRIAELEMKYDKSLGKLNGKRMAVANVFSSVVNQIQDLEEKFTTNGLATKGKVHSTVLNNLLTSMNAFNVEKIKAEALLNEVDALMDDNTSSFTVRCREKVVERINNLDSIDTDMQARVGAIVTSQQPDQVQQFVPRTEVQPVRAQALKAYSPKSLNGVAPTKLQPEVTESHF